MRKYLKEIKELQELKDLLSSRDLPEIIVVEGNDDLGEFFQIDGELLSDAELLKSGVSGKCQLLLMIGVIVP